MPVSFTRVPKKMLLPLLLLLAGSSQASGVVAPALSKALFNSSSVGGWSGGATMGPVFLSSVFAFNASSAAATLVPLVTKPCACGCASLARNATVPWARPGVQRPLYASASVQPSSDTALTALLAPVRCLPKCVCVAFRGGGRGVTWLHAGGTLSDANRMQFVELTTRGGGGGGGWRGVLRCLRRPHRAHCPCLGLHPPPHPPPHTHSLRR
jgi:hypothetical protein